MKSKESIESLLKKYYQDQKRAIRPEETFDRKVLEQALAKQSERGKSSGKQMRRRLVEAVVATAAILTAAFMILERKAPLAEQTPQKEPAGKRVSSSAASIAGMPTLFQVNLIMREKGFEEACKSLTYAPKSTEPGTTLRFQRTMRLGTDSNGS